MYGRHEDTRTVWRDLGGPRLDQLLKSSGIKSIRVARELGVDQSMVSRWRSGERVPDADQLGEMLRMANSPGLADYVLGLTPFPAGKRR